MTYATQSGLIQRYGEQMLVALTDRADVPSGAIDADVVARALAEADALIDGYLAGRYSLPLTIVPPILPPIAEVIAIYSLHITEPEAKVKADYEAAMKRLAEISKGVILLKDAAGIEPPATGTSGAQITDRTRDFTPGTMTGFI
jgi:phage gp36-like protein